MSVSYVQLEVLNLPIKELAISKRALNALTKYEVMTIGQLVHMNEAEVLRPRGIGRRSLRHIKKALSSSGLCLSEHSAWWHQMKKSYPDFE